MDHFFALNWKLCPGPIFISDLYSMTQNTFSWVSTSAQGTFLCGPVLLMIEIEKFLMFVWVFLGNLLMLCSMFFINSNIVSFLLIKDNEKFSPNCNKCWTFLRICTEDKLINLFQFIFNIFKKEETVFFIRKKKRLRVILSMFLLFFIGLREKLYCSVERSWWSTWDACKIFDT